MKFRVIVLAGLSLATLSSCKKAVENVKGRFGANAPKDQFVDHIIAQGTHNSDKNAYKPVNTSEMKFKVIFDNSAVYSTVDPWNQGDINKLYGFSDNNQDHHTNSARIGWRWFENQLQLFAYVYNNTVESDKLIAAVPLNQEISCSIRAAGDQYIFTVNGTTVSMSRASATPEATGYQLYPYFGGD
ncbi:MAG TPA: hypothetical protein VF145_03630, partial [Chitinophagaceae bacterium]